MRKWFPAYAIVLASALLSADVGPAVSHETAAKGLKIAHPWVRATPRGQAVGAGYVKIVNTGKETDRLIGASIDGAAMAELHETIVDDAGVAQMRMRPEGFEIAPGATLELKPLGPHVMFMGLAKPFERDLKVDGTLVFEKAGAVAVEFFIERAGANEPTH